MSGSENKAWDDGAEKPAEVVRRRGVEPGSYGGSDVVARSMDLIAERGGAGYEDHMISHPPPFLSHVSGLLELWPSGILVLPCLH